MFVLPSLRSAGALAARPMIEQPAYSAPIPSPEERAHLEQAHHEICTALTVLRSNVELVRVNLREEADRSAQVEIHRHLGELDMAVDRLSDLAARMRAWHHPDDLPPPTRTSASQSARLLP